MTRETFLNRKPATKTITLADNESVTIRKLTQADVERAHREYATDAKALEGMRFIVSRGVVDESGARLLVEGDLAKLADIDFETVKTIAEEINAFSGLSKPEPAGK